MSEMALHLRIRRGVRLDAKGKPRTESGLERRCGQVKQMVSPPRWWVKLWQRLPRGGSGKCACLHVVEPWEREAIARDGWQILAPSESARDARATLSAADTVDSLVALGHAWDWAAPLLRAQGLFLVGVPTFPEDVEAWRSRLESEFDATVHLVDPVADCPWLLAFGWKGDRMRAVRRSVLMVSHSRALDMFGGGETQLLETLYGLRRHGVRGDLSLSMRLGGNRYDLVHLFSLFHHEKLALLRQLPVPVVVSTIFWDYSELRYASAIVRAIFSRRSEDEVAQLLDAWRDGSLRVHGFSPQQARESPALRASQRAVLSCARALLPNCRREVQMLEANFGQLPARVHVIPNAVRPERYLAASKEPFVRQFGLQDFVLCAGRIEPNKNQMMLIWALRDTGLPLVLAGSVRDEGYAELCRKWAGDNVHFLGELSPHLLASAYAAARVHALASWSETPGLVNLEAGLSGCSLVVGNRGAEMEYLGEYAIPCDPGDWRSIRQAVLRAWQSASADRAGACRRHILDNYTWSRAATMTAQVYEEILAELSSGRRVGIAPERTAPPAPAASGRDPKDDPFCLVWEGSQFLHHSLALVNRELCLQLIEAGCELSILPYEPDQFAPDLEPRFLKLSERVRAPLPRPAEVHVRHRWPPDFSAPPEGLLVVMQPWEYGSVPKLWVELMSTVVDEVWVPSSYVRDCYIRSGVPAERVYVVPNGVNPEVFHPDVPPLDLGPTLRGRFKFLFVGGTLWRKGIDLLLQAYRAAFDRSDDVCLVIKGVGGQGVYRGNEWGRVIAEYAAQRDKPPIVYMDRDLPPAHLARLYTACDCLVHPYRGEGFGLPIAEAMACGLPVIVTNYGAALDFCDPRTAYLIPAVERRLLTRRVGPLEAAGPLWVAEPDVEALAQLMRRVYEHPAEAKAVGRRASQHIRRAFSWRRSAERVLERLHALRGQALPRHHASRRDELPLAEKRSVHLLLMPDWADPNDRWQMAMREFLREFKPHEDVGLVIRIDPARGHDQEEILARIRNWAAAEGIDLDAGHMLLVLNDWVDPSRRGLIYRTSHVFVDTSAPGSLRLQEHQMEAAAYGLLLCQPRAFAMRAAYEAVREQRMPN